MLDSSGRQLTAGVPSNLPLLLFYVFGLSRTQLHGIRLHQVIPVRQRHINVPLACMGACLITCRSCFPCHLQSCHGLSQQEHTESGKASRSNRHVLLVLEGSSFMMYQIRKMVGLAVAVARGVAPLKCIATALTPGLHVTVPTAPAEGLILVCVA